MSNHDGQCEADLRELCLHCRCRERWLEAKVAALEKSLEAAQRAFDATLREMGRDG